jgi:hypothetical protein
VEISLLIALPFAPQFFFTKDGTKETERERKKNGSPQVKFVVIPHLGNKPNKVNWIFS